MKIRTIALFIVTVVLALGTVLPLIHSGFFPMHDDTQVGRVVAMGRALRDGQFPVRWVSDLGYGYGYPIYNFYAPLPYYVGGLIYALGIEALTATKIMFAIGILLPVVTMYFLISRYAGAIAALLASILFVYAPYHAVQVYVRGAVGEFWTLGFYPLIFWAIIEINRDSSKKTWDLLGGIGLSGVILSHTLLGFATTIIFLSGVIIYSLVRIIQRSFDKNQFFLYFRLLLIALGISAFFWLPALVEMKYTSVDQQVSLTADFHDHFVCPSQLWNSLWGFGGSAKGCLDGISFKLGKVHIIASLVTLLVSLWQRKRYKSAQGLVILSMMMSVIGLFFMLPESVFVWERVPGLVFLQYPWRFIAWETFSLSVLGGLLLFWIKNFRLQLVLSGLLVLFVLLGNTKLFSPQYIIQKTSGEYVSQEELRFRVSKISDEYLPKEIQRPRSVVEIPNSLVAQPEKHAVVMVKDTSVFKEFIIRADNAKEAIIQQAYFPGWRFRVNGNPVNPSIDSGLPVIPLLSGENKIIMIFTDTPIRKISNIISFVTLIAIGIRAFALDKSVNKTTITTKKHT